jgi:predicted RNase H-like nuclease
VLDAADYREACAINRLHLGTALSKQSWNLLPKIRELDAWLRQHPPGPCREAHPELVYQALNRGVPLAGGKHTVIGLMESFT